MNEEMNMRGHLTLLITDREGRIIDERRQHNHIVKTGRELVAKLFAGSKGGAPPSAVTHMGVGTDATPPNDDQTALIKPRNVKDTVQRKQIDEITYTDFTETTTGVKRVRASLKAIFDFEEANGTEALREAGIFTAVSGGVMYNRVVFDAVTKTNAFKLTLLWDITF
ncbi:MAG TPA: hypothetical protein VF666_10370 [Pyrinomonadaceae bacterium]